LLAGSIATASCGYRPRKVSGSALRPGFSDPTGLTSNTQPWSRVSPSVPAFFSVSSQVSQVPQGVVPPAQLLTVPDRLTYSRTRSPVAESSMLVVPPPPAGS
jgi:hypothetical protein